MGTKRENLCLETTTRKYKENFSNLMHGEPCLQKWVGLFPFKGEILNTQQAYRQVVFLQEGVVQQGN